MRNQARFVALALVIVLGPLVVAGEGAGERLKRDVEFLASERLAGRLTGDEGERLAADYLVSQLEAIGVEPLPGAASLRHSFEFTAGTNDAGSVLVARTTGEAPGETARFSGVDDVAGLSFSDNGTVDGEVVFAGYGIELPGAASASYDSYAGLDVKDKIVAVLRYWPENVSEQRRDEISRYAGLRHKALVAREHGAKALLVLTGPGSPNAGKTVEAKFDAALAGSGIVAASVSGTVAERLFAAVEGGLAPLQAKLDREDPHTGGLTLPDLSVTLTVKVEREKRTGQNVVGWLEPQAETQAPPGARPDLVLGAHYDHLGLGRHGNSLARREELGRVHPGADDNASGVAAVLEAARRLSRETRARPMVFAFWSGEELGLLGSTDFIGRSGLPGKDVSAYLNFDMVGRVRDNRLSLQGTGASSVWPRLIEETNVPIGFDLQLQSDPYLPTDASAWYRAGVPILGFFSGQHQDYHRPSDRAETLNYQDLARVVDLAVALSRRLDRLTEPPDYVKIEIRPEATGDREALRAYTGTIPDYAAEVDGLRLSGVVSGGPAEKAGLREGDVIVEFAGRRIANIYDYTYALAAVKIGEPIQVVYLRGKERLSATVVPTTRP